MFQTYLFTFLLGIATFLQFAVDRAPDLDDSHDNKAARRVLIAGLLTMFMWMGYRCWTDHAPNPLPLFGMMLIAIAEIMFCFNRLFPEFGSAIRRTTLRNAGRGSEGLQ